MIYSTTALFSLVVPRTVCSIRYTVSVVFPFTAKANRRKRNSSLQSWQRWRVAFSSFPSPSSLLSVSLPSFAALRVTIHICLPVPRPRSSSRRRSRRNDCNPPLLNSIQTAGGFLFRICLRLYQRLLDHPELDEVRSFAVCAFQS